MRPRVAGLVLNYNGRDITLETLESLTRVDYDQLDLVVVDNGSTDGSFAAIAEKFPSVRQLRVARNRGISWGLDHGIAWALEQGYDYLLLMNNDIQVAPDMLTEMVILAGANPRIGCVGPKSYYHSDPQRLWSTGGILRFRHSLTVERGDGQIDRGQYDQDQEVPYINGCAMLVRATALRATGYWDPNYFLGLEDADFCVRMKAQGFTCWYAHRARLWHMISHSIGVYKPTRTFHTGRSSAIFLRRHAKPQQTARALAWFTLAMPLAFVRELMRGNHQAVLEKVRGLIVGFRAPLSAVPTHFDDLVDSVQTSSMTPGQETQPHH